MRQRGWLHLYYLDLSRERGSEQVNNHIHKKISESDRYCGVKCWRIGWGVEKECSSWGGQGRSFCDSYAVAVNEGLRGEWMVSSEKHNYPGKGNLQSL